MSQRTLRLTSILGNAISFADPLHVMDTTSFKQDLRNASNVIGLVPIQRVEMVSLKAHCVKPENCGTDSQSTMMQSSVRVSVNSPLWVSTATKQQVLDALENFKRAVENGLLDGLKPTATDEFVVDSGIA